MTAHFCTMIQYHPDLDVLVAFPPLGHVEDTLFEVASKAGLGQAKVVESEKAIHVSFFSTARARNQLRHLAEQGDLFLSGDPAFLSAVNTPDKG